MHKELVKVFNGEPLPIRRIDEDNFYININGIARAKGKKITDWAKSKSFKKYLSAREISLGFKGSLIISEIDGKYEIHNSLLINFSMWLNPEFAVWAEDMIFDILTGKKQLQLENQTKMLKEVENKYAKQISDLKCEVNKKTQHKLITYADQTQSLRKWIGDKFPEYEISERELWKFLAKHPDGFMRVIPATKTSNVIVNMDYGKNVGDSIAFNDAIIPYIQEFIGDTDLTKKPQQGKFEF